MKRASKQDIAALAMLHKMRDTPNVLGAGQLLPRSGDFAESGPFHPTTISPPLPQRVLETITIEDEEYEDEDVEDEDIESLALDSRYIGYQFIEFRLRSAGVPALSRHIHPHIVQVIYSIP
jgi:hypothetical protein